MVQPSSTDERKLERDTLAREVDRRRTFAIISHPDAGKTTLTDIEVASRLGVSRFTVRSWRLKGVGPRFLKLGRAVRYRPQDVDDYERQALVETQAPRDHSLDVIKACAETH